jgi:hypothetical protein
MPLMNDWATHLRKALDARENGLAGAVGLTEDMSSESFEKTVGELLGLHRLQAVRDRFRELGAPTLRDSADWVREVRRRETDRLATFLDVINLDFRGFRRRRVLTVTGVS